MSLYWKDIEIVPGMVLEVDQLQQDLLDSEGRPVVVKWKILSFGSRTSDEAYLEYSSGKKYPLKRVVRSRRLQAKLAQEKLLQIPACSEFMVVQEYHDDEEVFKRCCNLDMLATVRNIRVITPEQL